MALSNARQQLGRMSQTLREAPLFDSTALPSEPGASLPTARVAPPALV